MKRLIAAILFLPLFADSQTIPIALGYADTSHFIRISNQNTLFPPPRKGTLIDILSDNMPFNPAITITSYRPGIAGAFVRGQAATGSIGSPGSAIINQTLIGMGGDGYGVDSFHNVSTGSILIKADGTFSNTSAPTRLDFFTTNTGTTTAVRAMVLKANGTLQLPLLNSVGIIQTNSSGDVSTALLNSSQVTTALGYTPVSSSYTSKTATYSILSTDNLIECSGTFTVTLLSAVTAGAGKQFTITNSGTGVITLASVSSQKIGNSSSSPTSISVNQGSSVTVYSNGSDWRLK